MGFRIKDGLFSVNPASVGRSLWIRSCGVQNCPRRATVSLGIDMLIANILVLALFFFLAALSPSPICVKDIIKSSA